MSDQPVFLRLSIMMFLQFFVWGGWYVTTSAYIPTRGWDEGVIGWAYTVGPIAAIISPLFLGMVADRFFATQKVLAVLHLLGAALLFVAPMVEDSSGLFIGILLGHMLCYMPTLGLTNTLSFHHIKNQEKQFPIIRMFGTLGWIAAVYLASDYSQEGLPFQLAGGAGILLGLYSFSLPHTPPPLAGRSVSVREILCVDALSLMKQPAFAIFMLASFLICIPLAGYYSFALPFISTHGYQASALNYGQATEVVFMFLMPFFFARLGVKWMLMVGMAAWVLRYVLFALGADAGTVWMIYGGIALHGICYDFFFVTGQIYVDKAAPRAIRGQAQGFLVLMTQGLGLGIGAQVFSRLVAEYRVEAEAGDGYDWSTIWLYPAAAAGVILILFALSFRSRVDDAEPAA
ncbi:MAG: MFS transporter [Planctomycetota bacterium]|jgi:nucleoside transporter